MQVPFAFPSPNKYRQSLQLQMGGIDRRGSEEFHGGFLIKWDLGGGGEGVMEEEANLNSVFYALW